MTLYLLIWRYTFRLYIGTYSINMDAQYYFSILFGTWRKQYGLTFGRDGLEMAQGKRPHFRVVKP